MNYKFLPVAVLCVLLVFPLVSASSVTRTLSKTTIAPGESITVSINVDLTKGETFYVIDEIIPQGFTASNPSNDGSTTDKGHVKWVTIQDAKSTTLTYTLTAPQNEGTYHFSGQYGLDGTDEIMGIGGQNTITVSKSAPPASSSLIIAVVIVLVLLIIAAVVLLRKKS